MRHTTDIINQVKTLIRQGEISTQEAICAHLEALGYDINQSKISRVLRKIGAVKTKNEDGLVVYHLPKEPAPPTADSYLSDLVIDITANEICLIVHTSPGSASLIARVLDYHRQKAHILGTIAGDDTVLVIPAKIAEIEQTYQETLKLLEEK